MSYTVKRRDSAGRVRYTGMYRDARGQRRSAGTFSSKRAAADAAQRMAGKVVDRSWIDPSDGRITFRRYVDDLWWPSRHLEVSTKAGYRSYLDKHFMPYFGDMPMAAILSSTVQAWVSSAVVTGLSPRSVRKYHVLLHSIFKRAVRDRVVVSNPCSETELPKIVPGKLRIITPEEFERLLSCVPAEHRVMVITAVETGLRWGELVALRPRHVNFATRTLHVQQVYVEVSRKHSPTGDRMILKEYPKDNEPRSLRLTDGTLDQLNSHIGANALSPDDLLWSTRVGTPISRNTFRTRVWLPAVSNAGLGFHVRMHDLRHAHASWLLAGGADLKSVMERMGHSQITTTQRYLHTLPDADDQAIAIFDRMRRGRSA